MSTFMIQHQKMPILFSAIRQDIFKRIPIKEKSNVPCILNAFHSSSLCPP
ncbi:hypothetical protein ROSINTL182_06711 [Roseburia intestinalis L1-82]|uniref:Uncharacterized protein n=1 Tax=Roseburia intestinalis L1-82 TaxID=536231 RepID=C7G9Y1_9FIRM|nr:hypothetical protein ROSINTL182_06711 [Roseburia intestinalis L1-82]